MPRKQKKTTETEIVKAIRVTVSQVEGCVFWRNSRGVHKVDGRVIVYGLAPGAADLIGGIDGRLAAIEVKKPGEEATPDQERFLRLVRRYGGFGCVVESVEQALAAIQRCKAGKKA